MLKETNDRQKLYFWLAEGGFNAIFKKCTQIKSQNFIAPGPGVEKVVHEFTLSPNGWLLIKLQQWQKLKSQIEKTLLSNRLSKLMPTRVDKREKSGDASHETINFINRYNYRFIFSPT